MVRMHAEVEYRNSRATPELQNHGWETPQNAAM